MHDDVYNWFDSRTRMCWESDAGAVDFVQLETDSFDNLCLRLHPYPDGHIGPTVVLNNVLTMLPQSHRHHPPHLGPYFGLKPCVI